MDEARKPKASEQPATPESDQPATRPRDVDEHDRDSERAHEGTHRPAEGRDEDDADRRREAEDDTDSGDSDVVSALAAGIVEGALAPDGGEPLDGSMTATAADRHRRGHLILQGVAERVAGSELQAFYGAAVGYGYYTGPRTRIGISIYYADADPDDASGSTGALRSASELGLDVVGRLYLAGEHTAMGLYGLAGFRGGLFWWNYRNPVPAIDDDGKPYDIDSDNLGIYGPYVGAGISLLQTRIVHLGANAAWGLRLHGDNTGEGFTNDVFPTVGFTHAALEVSLFPGTR